MLSLFSILTIIFWVWIIYEIYNAPEDPFKN